MWSLIAQPLLVGKGKDIKYFKCFVGHRHNCFGYPEYECISGFCMLVSLCYSGYLSSKCSARKNDDKDNLNYAWEVVKEKLLDSLDAIEYGNNSGNRALKFEQQQGKRPLSLYAVSEGPKLRLLWASFQQLEKEAGIVYIVSLHYSYNA